ncbi:hypothetical protein F5144DRAFT_614971 [Chaetomium tenue]|uniref:Uncharacterized protein n=1 Tax=Chaetomium tenue TaxID=1854479 RepID=A0ACB7NXC8_9PEZI|nr:hypothetical protein F5144DRAFT_614971 [Chaetomium globosum]
MLLQRLGRFPSTRPTPCGRHWSKADAEFEQPTPQENASYGPTAGSRQGSAYSMTPAAGGGPIVSVPLSIRPKATTGSHPDDSHARRSESTRSGTASSVQTAVSHTSFLSPEREAELDEETTRRRVELDRLRASPIIRDAERVRADKLARRAAKREVKKRQIEEAKAAGYEKREWSVSMLVLYDYYYDKGGELHEARKAYQHFRNKFRHSGASMTYDDHIKAANLAREWETAAKIARDARDHFFQEYPDAYALPNDRGHRVQIEDFEGSAENGWKEVLHHAKAMRQPERPKTPASSHYSIEADPHMLFGENIYDNSGDEGQRASGEGSRRQTASSRSRSSDRPAVDPRSSQRSLAQQSQRSNGSARTTATRGSRSRPVGYLGENGVGIPRGCRAGEPFYTSSLSDAQYQCKDKNGDTVHFNL